MTLAGEPQAVACEIDGISVPIRAGDLSLAGLFVQTTSPPKVDAEISVHLFSSIGQLEVRGHVVQIVSIERATREGRRPGFGVLFTDLSDDQRAWLGLTLDAVLRARKTLSADELSPPRARAADLAPPRSRALEPQPSDDAAPAPAEKNGSGRAPKAKPRRAQNDSPEAVRERAHKAVDVAASLRKEIALLSNKPPWTVLGLPSTSSAEDAKAAFLTISKRCHPHLYAQHGSAEVSKLATELFITYKRAYSVITKLAPRNSSGVPAGGSRTTFRSIAPAADTAPPATHTTPPPHSRARSR